MAKAVLSRFLIDRIHPDWIDRLFPQGWTVDRQGAGRERGRGDTGGLREKS